MSNGSEIRFTEISRELSSSGPNDRFLFVYCRRTAIETMSKNRQISKQVNKTGIERALLKPIGPKQCMLETSKQYFNSMESDKTKIRTVLPATQTQEERTEQFNYVASQSEIIKAAM